MQKLIGTGATSPIVGLMIGTNVAFFGLYSVSSGPMKLKLQNVFTMQPSSLPTSLVFTHFANTNIYSLLFNSGVLATIGSQLLFANGPSAFLRVFMISAGASSVFAAAQMRHKPTKSYAGGIGVSAGLITYTAFSAPHLLRMFRLSPMALVAATMLYGIVNEETAVLGSMSAGYAAFLLAL